MGCGASRVSEVGSNAVSKRRAAEKEDWSELQRIDAHVLRTPFEATQSWRSLAAYLNLAATTELEKVRAIYKWTTANITYQIEQNLKGRVVFPAEMESTLGAEFGYASGCAAIVGRLCQLMGIEHQRITGFTKGVGYNPVRSLTVQSQPNHAWNAMKVNGVWKLMDCTWGAGHISDNKEFVKKETDFYFLSDPEVFIEDHFPFINSNMEESMRWQLLPTPIDLATFHRRVRRQESCIEYDVELVSHKYAVIEINCEITLKFKGLGDCLTYFAASFVNPDTQAKVNSGSYIATVLDPKTNEASVTARPPTSGSFWELRIYGTTDGTMATQGLVSYQILAKSITRSRQFPNFAAFYGLLEDPARCGFTRNFCNKPGFWMKADSGKLQLKFATRGPVEASANLRFAEDEETTDDEPKLSKFCLLEQSEQELTVSMRLHRAGFYRLTLFCAGPEVIAAEKIPALANYLIDCERPMESARPYPGIVDCGKHRVDWTLNPDGFMDVPEEATLKFKGLGLPLTRFSAKFVHPSTCASVNSGSFIATVLDYRTNTATVTVRPPTSGVYWELRVFGTTKTGTMTSDLLACYNIRAERAGNFLKFPELDGFYGCIRSPERYGFSSDLRSRQAFSLKGCSGELQLLLPAQQTVFASALLHYAGDSEPLRHSVLLEMCEQVLKVSVRMHRRGFYRLTLFCKDVGSDSSSIPEFANFLIECSSPMERHRPFPEFLTRSLTERVSLDCPRDGELPANSDVHFRLSSPSLRAVMVQYRGQTVHHLSGSGFSFSVRTGPSGGELELFGAEDVHAVNFIGLFSYRIA